MKKNKIMLLTIAALNISTLFSCGKEKNTLMILFTNDVHCAFEENIGYSGLVSYRNSLKNKNYETLLVDCGDHIQGAPIGSLSKGEYIIDIMNDVNYDLAIPGNHEFDYTADTFIKLTEKANFDYISSNFCKTSDYSTVFNPYKIFKTDSYKIGFVGISTPTTIQESYTKNFVDEHGDFKYTFLQENLDKYYGNIQDSINALKREKVDYVIALAHLGSEGDFCSENLIKEVSGLDILLDGHSHSVVNETEVLDKNGNKVLLSQTGTQLNNIGQIEVNEDGLKISLVSKEEYTEKDQNEDAFIASIKAKYEASITQKIGHTDYKLSIYDENGNRLIRKKSTNMGDFFVDAFKDYGKTDMAFMNGGGIRADINIGDITYKDLMTVAPFGNLFTIIKAKGSEIKDFLEYGASKSPDENGQLMIPSGISYTIDSSKPSTVEFDAVGNFISVTGEYRVKDIFVDNKALDLDKEYTIAGTDFNISASESAKAIFKSSQILESTDIPDYQVLNNYLVNTLEGEVPEKYSAPLGEERIKVL